MNTIYDGSFVLGQTSATNFIAGPGITIDSPSAGTVRIGTDETVLWDGNGTAQTPSDLALSENVHNFERVRITFSVDMPQGSGNKNIQNLERPTNNGDWFSVNFAGGITSNNFHIYMGVFAFTRNGTVFTYNGIYHCWGHGSGSYEQSPTSIKCLKVVGINRISGSNA